MREKGVGWDFFCGESFFEVKPSRPFGHPPFSREEFYELAFVLLPSLEKACPER